LIDDRFRTVALGHSRFDVQIIENRIDYALNCNPHFRD